MVQCCKHLLQHLICTCNINILMGMCQISLLQISFYVLSYNALKKKKNTLFSTSNRSVTSPTSGKVGQIRLDQVATCDRQTVALPTTPSNSDQLKPAKQQDEFM